MIWNQIMDSIRKWLYKPRKDDKSLLAQFFFSDEALNLVAGELDSFDGRQEPERCTNLVQQLRQCQDRVLHIVDAIMNVLIGNERANRDFRVKFPEDVLQDNLSGQLWFGAECLAAGSSIMNRESESTTMRPLAKALVKSLENVRNLLREVCLRSNTPNGPLKLNNNEYITEMLLESLKIFDRLFADFELCYVSAMVNVKTAKEYELQELIGVLFSETLTRALQMNLITQDMIDDCDPGIMFAIPRLAIIHGLLIYPNGPLCVDKTIEEMSEMFKPFRTLLHKIRELLWTLSNKELFFLEKSLCDNHIFDKKIKIADDRSYQELLDMNDNNEESDVNKIDEFYKDFSMCKDAIMQNASKSQQHENASTSSTNSLNDQILAPTISVQKFLTKSGRKQLIANRKSNLKLHLSDDPMLFLKADIANRNEIKAKFRSSEDLLHRLFVCVSGVADQLQTNFASDLRNILKAVYLINSSKSSNTNEPTSKKDNNLLENLEYLPSANDVIISGEYSSDPNLLAQEALFDTSVYLQRLDLSPTSLINNNTENVTADTSVQLSDSPILVQGQREDVESTLQPPIWIPDMEAPKCMGCEMNFTVLKRRHHCRNCGKIFCSKCSANNMPLPQFGLTKPVRVCNHCFLYRIQM